MTGLFSVKLKSKKGQFIIKDLSEGTSLQQLLIQISELTSIAVHQLHVLIGYPPRLLDLSEITKNLSTIGITSGETLIVEERNLNDAAEQQSAVARAVGHQQSIEADEALARRLQAEEEQQLQQVLSEDVNIVPSAPHVPIELPSGSSGNFNGILLKKVVPADNSCLFTSIRFVLNGKVDNEGSELMRNIIAQEVAASPQEYNDGVLGKPNAEYCTWIQKPDSWGGAIEVAILSNFYGIEIDVVDIQNAIINRFGEDKNYGVRVFLLFDGIHYDPLYMEMPTTDTPATIFPVEELGVYRQAEQLANEAKSSRQFTNVNKFSLRCLDCDMLLVGQSQVQQHAKATGHTNFGEV